MREAAQ